MTSTPILPLMAIGLFSAGLIGYIYAFFSDDEKDNLLIGIFSLGVTLIGFFLCIAWVVDEAAAEVYTLSRMDCGVLASNDCGRQGRVSVVEYNQSTKLCDWLCRPPRYQYTCRQHSVWFMRFVLCRRV